MQQSKLIKTLKEAYDCTKDPSEKLFKLLEKDSPTPISLKWLIQTSVHIHKGTCRQKEIEQDLDAYEDSVKKENQTKPSLICRYIYFATSICHLFGKMVNEDSFFPNVKLPIIIYGIRPNVPMKYIWIDIDDKEHRFGIACITHNLSKLQKFKIQRINNLNETVKVSVDLLTKDITPASRGTFLGIDGQNNVLQWGMEEEDEPFCLLLTFKKKLKNIYCSNLETCTVFCHHYTM